MTDVRGLLLDVDGTLVDSGYHHALSWWQALRKQGLDVPVSTIHRAVGMGSDKLVPHVVQDAGYSLDDVDEDDATAAHSAIYSTFWPALRLLPGARELVSRAHGAGLTTVLASSAGPEEVAVLRRVLDVDDLLDAVTGAGDAEQSKPAPDLVVTALGKADLDAGACVFVGDSVWDVHAAHDAGVRCVGVECGGTSASELREAGAVEVYRDAADLVAHWDDSVLGGSR
ncbi:HAD family hydrolase [Jatrophihabitans fulvus]